MQINKNSFLFLPLGGAGEIGLNLSLYHYQGKWLIIDFGAGFADDYLPGVDLIVPDIEFILKRKENLLGIILTHAHEDHIGAIQYLWNELKCPIYATKFTSSLLKAKLVEMSFAKQVIINELEPQSCLELDPFTLNFIAMTHSSPEMQGVVIKTQVGSVFHTGDWKFDPDPLISLPTNQDLIAKYTQDKILALIGDSTNIFSKGSSGSEGELRKNLVELIASKKNLVVVTTFASNVARLETLFYAAQVCNRKVVLAGRSLWRIARAAKESGYLNQFDEALDERQIANHPRDKLLVICTGCQGEPMAAATKMATKIHPIQLKPNDTVIFSSKIIPGNEKKLYRLFNLFTKMRIEILTEKDHFVHVSGHPSRDDIKSMYQLIRPEVVIPVHGELVHMHEHAKMAIKWGAKAALEIEDGDIIEFAAGNTRKIAKIEVAHLAVDGNYLLPTDSQVLKKRRKIQQDGAVIITLILGLNDNQLKAKPIINSPGSLDSYEDKQLIEFLQDSIYELLDGQEFQIKDKTKAKLIKYFDEKIINQTRSTIKRIVKQEVGKYPLIEVQIQRL